MSIFRPNRSFGFRHAMLLTAACFALIALGVTTVAIVSRNYSRRCSQQTETLTRQFLPGTIAFGRLYDAADDLNYINLRFALARDEAAMDAQKHEFQTASARVNRSIAELTLLTPDETTQRLIAVFNTDMQRYRENAERFQAELGAGEFEKAMATLDHQLVPDQDKTDAQLGAIGARYYDLSQNAGARTTALLVQSDRFGLLSTIMLSGFTLLSLIFSLAGTAFLLKQVQKRDAERQTAHDTLEKRVEERTNDLAASLSILDATLNSTADGILVVDDENQQILKNQQFNELWKVPREIAEAPDDRKCLEFATTQAKNSAEFFEKVSYLYEHPDEISRDEIELIDGTYLDRYSSPVRDKSGKNYGRIWTFRDLTERKKSEEALRESKHFIESVTDAAANFIYVFDIETGTHAYTNRSASEFLGYSPAQILELGKSFLPAIVHPDDLAGLVQRVTQIAGAPDGAVFEFEYRVKHASGDWRWIWTRDCVFKRRPNGAAWQIIGVAQDTTRRKHAEAELDRVHKELLAISRQAGMSEIATSVLHNVGNVLNSVNVSADLLADHVRKTPVADLSRVVALLREHDTNLGGFFTEDPRGAKVPEFLGKLAAHFSRVQETQLQEVVSLQKNVEHIKEIVAMQQSYARVSGLTERLHVTDLVEDALRMNLGAFQRHEVEVVREFAPGLPAVITERHKLLQILINLLSNAKYACDGADRGAKRVTVRAAQADGRMRVEVSDTGVGIAPEHLGRIFNLGFTTKKDGHGFGLHSAANAAREMGGSLSMHSDGPGRGATFTLDLPMTHNGHSADADEPSPAAEETPNTELISAHDP